MNQVTRNKLIEAAKQLQQVQDYTNTYLRARGAYGSSSLYIVDQATGEEIGYEEALLLEGVEDNV